MASGGLSLGGILLRFLFALLLVYASFNPEGYSYFDWVIAPMIRAPGGALSTLTGLKFVAGVALIIGWAVFLQATKRSIGVLGVVLALALIGGLIWIMIDWHVLNPRSTRAITHIVLISVSLVLAVGMSWSILSRRVTGQVDTERVA